MKKNILIVLVLAVVFVGSIFLIGDTEEDPADINDSEEEIVEEGEEADLEETDIEEADLEETDIEDDMDLFVDCLKENDVTIYGSDWCPFCRDLVDSFGGYEVVSPIYVECTEEEDRCADEMQGRGVPEIQVENEIYQGSRDLAVLGGEVGCEL